ncbi:MAG: PHP domain-containing protein [Bacteroidales bacterium]|nr:PHP domain-containing protein [Bacteroidales bacterium]
MIPIALLGAATLMKFDLHMHTSRYSPCSVTEPLELVESAVAAGLDGIVITEHHHVWAEEELAELRAAAPGLIILAAVEVTCVGGDILVYGVQDATTVPRGITWPELVREVHRQDGATVIAHPYRWGQPIDQLLADLQPEFDGIELMSTNMEEDIQTKASQLFSRMSHLAPLGNSDSHNPETVGAYYTEFPDGTRTIRDIVTAIRQRQTRPAVRRKQGSI